MGDLKRIEGATWEVPDFPWDRWCEHACAAGVSEALAQLGREVMREAYQHQWSAELAVRCGWNEPEDGEEIAPGFFAPGPRWTVSLGSCAAMITEARERPDEARERWRRWLDTDGERGRWDESTGRWIPNDAKPPRSRSNRRAPRE